jgi:hypothetical protein
MGGVGGTGGSGGIGPTRSSAEFQVHTQVWSRSIFFSCALAALTPAMAFNAAAAKRNVFKFITQLLTRLRQAFIAGCQDLARVSP